MEISGTLIMTFENWHPINFRSANIISAANDKDGDGAFVENIDSLHTASVKL